MLVAKLPREPHTFAQAVSDPKWIATMENEFQVLQENGTWSLFPRPQDRNVIRNTWVFKIKQKPDSTMERLTQSLLNLGFIGSLVDTSLFMLQQFDVHIFILIYVDDIIVTLTHLTRITELIGSLQTEFKMKDLGDLSYFLGIHVHQDDKRIHLNQAKYIVDLLGRVNMVRAKAYTTPCTSPKKLTKFDGDPLPDLTQFRHIVKALQYCTLTKPDISYSVNQLCQFMHCPTTAHFTAAKRVLRYLKGTTDFGLYLTLGPLHLEAFCDSDWAVDPADRRSTSGYSVFLGQNLISWQANKQPVVSRSSIEAKYLSMAIATIELYWLRMLLKELQINVTAPPHLWCDNLGATALAYNLIFHARIKHIEVDYHFIREKVFHKDIVINYISTNNQCADIFTP
ncbi:hypothetical protein F2P56_014624 [Juglans regia]|uniref:Uncharacterized mitochondrial protein AtMg00810-like n=2 Tax=Juglans regia TaxID=51240 RepID=A0A2I4ETR2_JUGRE|nr:uncharacterized mitochondrial protein AtMg00810-like [Juglans regia]KAF5464553.1 hypothetical protein F2P56_014624 [Juglans regia]